MLDPDPFDPTNQGLPTFEEVLSLLVILIAAPILTIMALLP